MGSGLEAQAGARVAHEAMRGVRHILLLLDDVDLRAAARAHQRRERAATEPNLKHAVRGGGPRHLIALPAAELDHLVDHDLDVSKPAQCKVGNRHRVTRARRAFGHRPSRREGLRAVATGLPAPHTRLCGGAPALPIGMKEEMPLRGAHQLDTDGGGLAEHPNVARRTQVRCQLLIPVAWQRLLQQPPLAAV